MREIQLTQGKVALVDDEDFEDLSAFKWYAQLDRNTFYANHSVVTDGGVRTSEQMHRRILRRKLGRPLVRGEFVDHVDRDGLNNTRANLRIATQGQNQRNCRKPKHGRSSRFLGVCYCTRDRVWHARIMINKKNVNIGRYSTENAAVAAREKYIAEHAELAARSNFAKENP